MTGVMKKKARQKRTISEKLNAIKVTASMTPEATAAWCREQGIYVHEIAEWENEISNGISDFSKSTPSDLKHEMDMLKAENKALKKDLRRKDRALAETTARLVLKKKLEDFLGEAEE